MEFMKGMYVIWPDYDYIDKAIASGINTLFIAMEYISFEESISHYQGKAELIPIINWFREGLILPEDQQFFDGVNYYKSTPCPTSSEFIKYKTKDALYLCDKYNLNKISIDFEGYSSSESGFSNVLNYYKKWEDGGYVCKCDRCKNKDEKEQRTINAQLISKQLIGKQLHQLPYVNPDIWKISESWLNEFTYEEFDSWSKILKNTYRMKRNYDTTIKNISGFWTEKFTSQDYLDVLKKCIKSSSTDGYWLYPQMRMSKNCYWRLHPDEQQSIKALSTLPYHSFVDAPNDNTSDPEFFNKLKTLNDNINKYRSGIWFSIRSWFSGFFR